jgi:hypothetical protein
LFVLCVILAGCAAAPAPAMAPVQSPAAIGRGGPIDDELKSDPNLESLPWSASRPLRLTDFRAPVPDGATEGARTAYVLTYSMWCRSGTFTFSVTTSFLPEHSWVKPRAFTDAPEGRRILNHEQTHINQTEIYARRMRRFFQDQLYDPCGQTEAQLNALAERFVNDEAAAQQRYDEETSFGRVPERQGAWDASIREALAALQHYAAPVTANAALPAAPRSGTVR